MAGPLVNGAPADIWAHLTPGVVLAIAAAITVLLYLLRSGDDSSSKGSGAAAAIKSLTTAEEAAAAPKYTKDGYQPSKFPNLEGIFIPPAPYGLLYGNPAEPFVWENENTIGKFMPLHRPTWNKTLDKSGNYPHGAHFKGRKRLWEMRFQFRIKKTVQGQMRFGIELEEYVPLSAATKKLMGLTVAALRQVAGSELYHSPGDDPKKVKGEAEIPTFSMPLWAFDQFIETPEGEEPPSLSDPMFSSYGTLRTTDLQAYMREMNALELRPGPTYTFVFWGISQFLDDIKWEVTKVVPIKNIDFNLFCGKPPVHVVLYTLKDTADGEKRHLNSRKDYYFRLAFWSSKKPPALERIRQLLPERLREGGGNQEDAGQQKKGKSLAQKVGGLFACCAVSHRS